MLTAFTVLIMLIVAYAQFREGLFTAFVMLINVILAGLFAFNLFEPLSDLVDPMIEGSFLDGYQDFFFLILLFTISLGFLRWATNSLSDYLIDFPPVAQQFGGSALGLLTGYLLSGFLVCALETLPWHQYFIDFFPRHDTEADLRRYFPPDRAWLSLMRHAGAYPFARGEDQPDAASYYESCPTFDREGTFELRYFRHRRYNDIEGPRPYLNELDSELKREP
jgi:hypothetical protein